MPSRINMGPDGGPYIAINENNGNIELEDNTGTTVAIWDDANSQWDFQNNPISNVDSLTSNSVNTDDSVTVTTGEATDTLHYGSNQDRANAGDNSVALGIGARANGDDGAGGSINNHVAVGYRAARDNMGNRVTASGYRAAQNNTGNNVTASGYQAARGDGLADPTTMGDDNIGIGESAIRNNQASGLIAIGQEAGINAQTDDQLIITDRNGNRRMTMDLTNGNLNIDGTLTENATL